jgi:hypothetical protein
VRPDGESRDRPTPDTALGRILQQHARDDRPADSGSAAGSFVVVIHDPQTADTDSYGPYSADAAAAEWRRRREAFDEGGLDDVTIAVVPLWPS